MLLLLMPLYFLVVLFAPGFYLRYQLPLLPLMCLLAAAWIFRYVRWRALAVLLIVVQISCNALSLISAFPFRNGRALRFPLAQYATGIAAPYTNRFADVLDFFKAHSHPGESVLTFDPEFPLIFYTQLVVINGRIMAPPPGKLPDWILPRPASGVVAQEPVALPGFLKEDYSAVSIMVHDSRPGDTAPEPGYYEYQTARTRVPFLIYALNRQPTAKIGADTPLVSVSKAIQVVSRMAQLSDASDLGTIQE